MTATIPIVSMELREYLSNLLGYEISKQFFQKTITPMEEYSLHIYGDLTQIGNVIANLVSNGFEAYQHKNYSNLIITNPNGPNDIPILENPKEIIVDNRAAEMIYQGADVFVPGVKRANKVKVDDDVYVYNQKDVLVAKAKAKMSHNEMLTQTKGVAAKNIVSPYTVPSLELLERPYPKMYFQSVPAYLAGLNLDPKSGETILDCCAAPGNKTFHLNELTKNKAKIVAVDRSKRRIERIKDRINVYGASNVNAYHGNIIELSKEWTVKFDRILIDPPCSSLGLRPRLVHNIDVKSITSIANYQKAIFYACDKLLKDDGIVVYSTCTITKEENEDVIKYAVENLGYTVLEQEHYLSKANLSFAEFNHPIQRFLPGIDNTLGYFIAKLKKTKR